MPTIPLVISTTHRGKKAYSHTVQLAIGRNLPKLITSSTGVPLKLQRNNFFTRKSWYVPMNVRYFSWNHSGSNVLFFESISFY